MIHLGLDSLLEVLPANVEQDVDLDAGGLLVPLALLGDTWRAGVDTPELAERWARADAWLQKLSWHAWDASLRALAQEIDGMALPVATENEDDDRVDHALVMRDQAASIMTLALRACVRAGRVPAELQGLSVCDDALMGWDVAAGKRISRSEAARRLGARADWKCGWIERLPQEPDAPADRDGAGSLLEVAMAYVQRGEYASLVEGLAQADDAFAEFLEALRLDLRVANEAVASE